MKLTKNNYYSKKADQEYMSYSQFKQFDECPAKAMAILKGEWQDEQSDGMLVGSYVDAWLDGELSQFMVEHPELFNSRTGELKAQFKQADDICHVIEQDKYLFEQLKGKRQTIITGSIAGVKFKGKIDSLKKDVIVDGKVLKDCEDGWKDNVKMPFYKIYKYDIQAAVYQTLYQQMKQVKLPFRLAVVTKQKTPDKRVFEFSDETIQDALQEIITKAPIYDNIKQGKEEAWRCCKCDYCLATKKLDKTQIEII